MFSNVRKMLSHKQRYMRIFYIYANETTFSEDWIASREETILLKLGFTQI